MTMPHNIENINKKKLFKKRQMENEELTSIIMEINPRGTQQ